MTITEVTLIQVLPFCSKAALHLKLWDPYHQLTPCGCPGSSWLLPTLVSSSPSGHPAGATSRGRAELASFPQSRGIPLSRGAAQPGPPFLWPSPVAPAAALLLIEG